MILIVDFGSQTTHLIGRRIREMGASTKIVAPEEISSTIKKLQPKGIILSGSPFSVYEKDAPTIDTSIFKMNLPLLGICYGQQLIAHLLNGKVKSGQKKEFGPATLTVNNNIPLFYNLPESFTVWMSHGDTVSMLPSDFISCGKTDIISHAAIAHVKKHIYGIQFHPEVIHTQFGDSILKNFLSICGFEVKKQVINKKFVHSIIRDIKDSIRDQKAISALSGGVDSSVATLLVYKAIGSDLFPVYIDSGLMREKETSQLKRVFKKHYHMNIKIINDKNIFLKALKGVTDPEKKRQVIGNTFIKVLEEEAERIGAQFLVQGTIYPDVIESAGSKHSAKIKTHHNVAGLPAKMNIVLVEPLRTFYKDEVRQIGTILKLPQTIISRQPFPGPGLAIRIIGEVTDHKLAILRKVDKIVQEEVAKNNIGTALWQIFAVFTGIKTTGVKGDRRTYGDTIAIRAVEAKDAMSATWAKLPYKFLDRISSRIVNEVTEVNRVVYDITNKPPATIEWE